MILFTFLFVTIGLNASLQKEISTYDKLQFSAIQKGKKNNNTLLIIAGIQGDESGGFLSASFLIEHYTITKGSLLVVPNLNFPSIVKNSRGPWGDMNRKFHKLSRFDHDYKTVEKIKKIMLQDDVKFIVNMHDGRGYYRKHYVDSMHKPSLWGQSVVIDQENVDMQYGNLKEISDALVDVSNEYLVEDEQIFHLKNTHTKAGDEEMLKALTYFAISNKKAAIAHETSKSLSNQMKVFYKLIAIEKLMDLQGIKFKRDFNLNPWSIRKLLKENLLVKFSNNINLDLHDLKKTIKFFPLPKGATYTTSNEIISVVKEGSDLAVYNGNHRVTTLKIQHFESDNSLKKIKINIDGNVKSIKVGSIFNVKSSFNIKTIAGYRVNIIGFAKGGSHDESDATVTQEQILSKYSVDKSEKTFRIELYNLQNHKFAGWILAKFNSTKGK